MTPRLPSMRVSINYIDSSIEKSGSLDVEHHGSTRKVPNIRVFGRTEDGDSVCVNIHQVYPYIYVNYSGDMDHAKGSLWLQELIVV